MAMVARVAAIREEYSRLWEKRTHIVPTTFYREYRYSDTPSWSRGTEQTFYNEEYNDEVVWELQKIFPVFNEYIQVLARCKSYLPKDNIYAKRAEYEISRQLPSVTVEMNMKMQQW